MKNVEFPFTTNLITAQLTTVDSLNSKEDELRFIPFLIAPWYRDETCNVTLPW